jgi:BMFP domain-containing protein YqiC
MKSAATLAKTRARLPEAVKRIVSLENKLSSFAGAEMYRQRNDFARGSEVT